MYSTFNSCFFMYYMYMYMLKIHTLYSYTVYTCMFMYFRYEDRWRYIQGITSNTVQSCYEDFVQSVIHPLQTGSVVPLATGGGPPKHSPVRPLLSSSSISGYQGGGGGESLSSHSKLSQVSALPHESRWSVSSTRHPPPLPSCPPPPLPSEQQQQQQDQSNNSNTTDLLNDTDSVIAKDISVESSTVQVNSSSICDGTCSSYSNKGREGDSTSKFQTINHIHLMMSLHTCTCTTNSN